MDGWKHLLATAGDQHFVVTTPQIRAAGLPTKAIERRTRDEEWARLHRGVYTPPGAPDTPQRAAAAALLAVGEPAALTGQIAAHLYGMRDRPPDVVEVALPASRHLRPREGVVLRRSRRYDQRRRQRVGGLVLSAPAAVAGDLTLTLGHHDVVRAIARGASLRLLTLHHVDVELALRAGAPGAPQLRRALADLRGALSHSDAEHLLRHRLTARGVDLHPEPYAVRNEVGRTVAELDLAVVDIRYGIEVDGPHHLLPDQVAKDKRRDRAAGRCGWMIDRFPTDEVERDPDRVVAEVVDRIRVVRSRR